MLNDFWTKNFETANSKCTDWQFYLDEDTHRPSNKSTNNQMVPKRELSEEQDILPEDTEVTEKLPAAFKALS